MRYVKALELSELQFHENSYGVVKRFQFIMSVIKRYFGSSSAALHVLEVGCGTGNHISIPLAESGLLVTGIDIHPESIEYVQNAGANYSNLKFKVIPLKNCPNKHYDIVICSEVLEHVDNYADLLAEVVNKMAPDHSILILTIPNGFGPFEIQSWIWRNMFEDTWPYRLLRYVYHRRKKQPTKIGFLNKDNSHVNFFRFSQITTLFQQTNLNLEEYDGRTFLCGPFVDQVFILAWLCWINNWLGSVLPYWLVSGWMFVLSRSK